MKNRIGLILFGIGLLGAAFMACGLDSPGETWKIPMLLMIVFALVAAVGYLIMDMDEVLHGAGLQKVKESRRIRERKARNRNQVWNAWIATKNNAL